jgi:hypothetical protein
MCRRPIVLTDKLNNVNVHVCSIRGLSLFSVEQFSYRYHGGGITSMSYWYNGGITSMPVPY